MYNLIKADLFKLRKSLIIPILFAITTLCATVMTILAHLIAQGRLDGATGIGFLFSDVNVISIIGAVVAGAIICGDFDNKTIHEAISCGYGRGVIIISKTIVFFCTITFLLLPYAVATAIALGAGSSFHIGGASLGLLNLLTEGSGTVCSTGAVLKLISIIPILMLVYYAQLSVCIPLALTLKKPFLVVAVYYALSILSGQLAALKGKNATFDAIYSFTPYGGNHSLLTLKSGVGDIIKAIVISLIFIAGMIAITHCIFKKSEVK